MVFLTGLLFKVHVTVIKSTIRALRFSSSQEVALIPTIPAVTEGYQVSTPYRVISTDCQPLYMVTQHHQESWPVVELLQGQMAKQKQGRSVMYACASTWSSKRVESTNQKLLPANAHAHRDVFLARLPWQEMVKLNKGSIIGAHIAGYFLNVSFNVYK